jgi:hypothetical protein
MAQQSFLLRLGKWLQHKRNFHTFWIAWAGSWVFLLNLWLFWADIAPDQTLWWILFIFAVSMLCAMVSSWMMWHVARWQVKKTGAPQSSLKAPASTGDHDA